MYKNITLSHNILYLTHYQTFQFYEHSGLNTTMTHHNYTFCIGILTMFTDLSHFREQKNKNDVQTTQPYNSTIQLGTRQI